MTVFLNHVGVACALGSGTQAVREALWSRGPGDAIRSGEITDRYTPGRPLQLGTVTVPLQGSDVPASAALSRRSRNNALMLHTLAQIRGEVDQALAGVDPTRVAIVLGTSTSGIGDSEQAMRERARLGQWPAGFDYGQQELGSPAQYLAEVLGTAGPAYTLSTACSSSAKAMASAARLLEHRMADVVLAGGVDTLCSFTIAGFSALESVSAARCNPFSANRNGINLGEGAALFLMTRRAGQVRLAGWGETSDAHHISAPDPAGIGARSAMQQALARAGIDASAIDYLNLHGTATVQNDAMESHAVAAVLGGDVPVSSTKPMTGHALGAAGAIEAALLWLTLADNARGRLPAHWWDGARDPALAPLRLVEAGESLGRAPRYAMSNSFAFGGSNSTLILGEG